jgi:acetyl-CoA C-acetyltransferase
VRAVVGGDLDPRTPVVLGVGVADQAVDEPGGGLDALGLMLAATRTAGADTGSEAVLGAIGHVAVPDGTWSHADPGRHLATAVGAPGARTSLVRVGIPQQALFDAAYRAVRAGEVDVVLVVGGEAMRRTVLARRAGVEAPEPVLPDTGPDDLQEPVGEIITAAEIAGGLASPMAPFAMIDNALRAAEGRSVAAHVDEIARLWAGFSRVAAANPRAAFPTPRDPEFLRTPGPRNRPLAFPYLKWHCAQMHVDQAGAILIGSVAAARRLGVDPSRWVFPLVALESSLSIPLSHRAEVHRWPAMEVLGEAAAEHLGHPLGEIGPVECYSCYPSAVRVQQRALGLPLDGVPTITGGEPFAGGPWNNFVLQTTAAMVEHLRARPGTRGLVTSVSGLMNKPGLAVFSTEPGDRPLLVADLADRAAAVTARRPVVADHRGPAEVVTSTVGYDDLRPARTVVIARTPDGAHCVAACTDPDLAERATREELAGTTVLVDGPAFGV